MTFDVKLRLFSSVMKTHKKSPKIYQWLTLKLLELTLYIDFEVGQT